jgi:hypothetical protein
MLTDAVVWKFPASSIDDESQILTLDLPKGARVLTFDMDGMGELCAWAEIPGLVAKEVDMTPKESHRYLVVPTGAEFEYEGEYVTTVFIHAHPILMMTLVFHIYKLRD